MTLTSSKRRHPNQTPGPKLKAPGVYLKISSFDPAFNRGPAFNRENTVSSSLSSHLPLLPPQGFRPEGEIPRRHFYSLRVYYGKHLLLKYTVYIPEKNLDLLEKGQREIVG